MKIISNRLIAASASLMLAGSNLIAQTNATATAGTPPPSSVTGWKTNVYVYAGVGASIVEGIDINSRGGAKNDVDAGFRGVVGVGYHLTKRIDIGFESGAARNSLNVDPGQPMFGFSEADLTQLPLLVTGTFNLPIGDKFTTYAGVGIGGMASTLYLRTPAFGRDWQTDWTFAAQFMGGLKYNLDPQKSVGLEYRFTGSGNHEWFDNSPLFFTQTGDIFMHSIVATFTWQF